MKEATTNNKIWRCIYKRKKKRGTFAILEIDINATGSTHIV